MPCVCRGYSCEAEFRHVTFRYVVLLLTVHRFPPFQAHQHQRALSAFEEMQAAGVAPDRETFSAAAEACACLSAGDGASGGGMGARAMEIMRTARDQGLRRPAAKAVAATLAACVGGGAWREAIPAVEAMLAASGRHAWDDVMNFLAEAQQLSRRDREGRAIGTEEVDADDCCGGAVVAADAAALPGGRNADVPPFDAHNGGGGGSGACVTGPAQTSAPSQQAAASVQAGKFPGRSEAQHNGSGMVSPGKQEASTCVRLQTRPIPDVIKGPSEEADEDGGGEDGERRRSRQPRPRPSNTARGGATAGASFQLGGLSTLAAAAVDQAP